MESTPELTTAVRAALFRGDLNVARELCEAALQRAAEENDPVAVGAILDLVGDILQRAGSVDEARRSYASALAVFSRLGNTRGLGAVQASLGTLAERMGDMSTAAEHFEKALQEYESVAAHRGMARALLGLAGIAAERGAREDARRRYEEARRLYEGANEGHGLANARRGLASLLLVEDPRAAAAEVEAIIPLYEEHEDRLGEANCLLLLARAKTAMGASVDAERHARAAGKIFEGIHSSYGISQSCELRGELAVRDGDSSSAHTFFLFGKAKARESGRPHYEAWLAFRSGTVLVQMGRAREGFSIVEQARSDLLKFGQTGSVAEVDTWMAGARRMFAEGAAHLAALTPPHRLLLELLTLAEHEDRYAHLLGPIWPAVWKAIGLAGETPPFKRLLEDLIQKGVLRIDQVDVEGHPLQNLDAATAAIAHAVRFELPADRQEQILRVFERVWRSCFLADMIAPRENTVRSGRRFGVYLLRRQQLEASTNVLRGVLDVARSLGCNEEAIWADLNRAAFAGGRADWIQWNEAARADRKLSSTAAADFARSAKACGLFLALVSCTEPDDRLSYIVDGIWRALWPSMCGPDEPLDIEVVWRELQDAGLLRFTTTDHDTRTNAGVVAVRRYELDAAADVLRAALDRHVRNTLLLALARAWADFFARSAGSPNTQTMHAGFGVAVYLSQMGDFKGAFDWLEQKVLALARSRGEERWVWLHLQRIAQDSGDPALADRFARLRP